MRKPSILLGFLLAGLVGLPAGAQPRALDDAGIVAIFDLANTADIETGQLAMQRGHSKEVRDFGRMLFDAHTAVRKKGRDLAKTLGVTPALPAGDQSGAQHAKAMQHLRSLSGVEFDRAFTQHELDFHTAVLTAVKGTLLPAIQNRELKEFVTSLAPAFEAHRLGAEALRNKLGS